MPPKSRIDDRSALKISVLLGLIAILTIITGAVISAFPQHLYVGNETKLGEVSFEDNNTAIIKGNQVQYGANDVIPLKGREYIKLTGRQVALGETVYQEGIRTVFTTWSQNILLQQNIGTFSNLNQQAQVGVDGTIINLNPVSQDALNVNAITTFTSSNYTIQFTQDTIYLSEGGALVKLVRNKEKVTISLIGSGYKSIWFRLVTSDGAING